MKEKLIAYNDQLAPKRDKYKKRNGLYYRTIYRYYTFSIPVNSKVAEIGCGTGDLLYRVKPSIGLGIDFSGEMIRIARDKYPQLTFKVADAEDMDIMDTFDYIIVSDLLSSLRDIQAALKNIRKLCHDNTKIIFSNFNYIWEPLLKLGELFRIRQKQPLQNWLSVKDIENLLYLEGYEMIKLERKLLIPKYVPVLGFIFNRFFANLPGIAKSLCLNSAYSSDTCSIISST